MTMGYYSFGRFGFGQDYYPGEPDVSCAPGTTAVLSNGNWTCQAAPISCPKGTPVLTNGVWGCSGDASAGGVGANWGSCKYQGVTGKCQDKSKSCGGSYRAGLCPGPTNVQCCLPKTTQPSAPAAPAASEYGPFEKPQTAGIGGGSGGMAILLGAAAALFLFARTPGSSVGRSRSSKPSRRRTRRNPCKR
jgi:hypothetical protein